jgi:hypothetical protein
MPPLVPRDIDEPVAPSVSHPAVAAARRACHRAPAELDAIDRQAVTHA